MLSAALIRQFGRSRRFEGGSRKVPRSLPVALFLGSLAVVAVTVTACAVVLDGGVGTNWAEAVAAQPHPSIPTPPPTQNAGPTPAYLVGQPGGSGGAAQLAYSPSAPQVGNSGPGRARAAAAAVPPPSPMQRAWNTIKLMFR